LQPRAAPRPAVSIVTTVYRSRPTIAEFLRRAIAAVESVTDSLEVVVVDDGSPDDSREIVRDIARRDERVTLVVLSRNFGHHRAMLAGLEVSRGDIVFLIDSDLEEAPEHFADMLSVMRQKASDVVYGVQNGRKGRSVEKLSGWLFYRVFNMLSEVDLPRNVATMRLMTRRYVDSLLRMGDRNPVFVPLSILTGYPQVAYRFDKKSSSETTYSLRRRFSLLLLALTSFTGRPLTLMFWASLFLSFAAFLFGAYIVLRALVGNVQDGWSSLMAAIVFFFSLNALFTGTIGLYVRVIMDEIKDRPRTIVQEIFRSGQ
jgi:putative glycosyltransferase